MSIALTGNTAFVADNGTIRVIDISDRAHPVGMGSIAGPGKPRDITVGEQFVFVTILSDYPEDPTRYKGLRVFDPKQGFPYTTYGIQTSGSPYGVAASGNFAFVANGPSGLQVVDATDIRNLKIVSNVSTDGDAFGVAIYRNYLYVAQGSAGVSIFDIADPRKPEPVGLCRTPGSALAAVPYGENYLLVADFDQGMSIIDVSSPSNPSIAGTYRTSGFVYDIAVQGTDALIADYSDCVQVVSLTDIAEPLLIARIAAPGLCTGVTVDNGWAYVAAGTTGMNILDINYTKAIEVTSCVDTPGRARQLAMAAANSIAVVADYNRGLELIDVSNPGRPQVMANVNTGGTAFGVCTSGNYAYVANYSAGILVVDISSPQTPILAGGASTFGTAYGLCVEDGYAYVANGAAGLQIMDVASPANPQPAGAVNTAGFSYDVRKSGHLVYVADGASGLAIVDVSNPMTPRTVSTVDTPGIANAVAIDGHYAYVADNANGLVVVDVSTATAPAIIATVDTPGNALGIDVLHGFAYVGDDRYGVQLINIGDPARPYLCGNVSLTGSATGVCATPGFVCVASKDSGLTILPGNCETSSIAGSGEMASSASPLRVFPNPATSSVSIRLTIGDRSPQALEIYDVRGRCLRTIRIGTDELAAGDTVWDGRDGNGRAVPAGLYFIRARGSGKTRTAPVLIIR